ncbi:MAG: hypothetical protein IJZ03_08445 [Clostridia bacterium]|nr:hypothetical protein [Clostridia bacterium]
MKFKKAVSSIFSYILLSVIFILLLPFLLLFLVFKLIMTPFDYVKYKRSRYQQDFPHKYSWLRSPHIDNELYTLIKEKALPIEYVKDPSDYDLPGFFIFRNILLVFYEPLFFDREKGIFISYPETDDEHCEDEHDCDNDTENTDDCLSISETSDRIINEFRAVAPDTECDSVVFLYKRKNLETMYAEGALAAAEQLDEFIIYEKGTLETAIRSFIDTH